MKFSKLLADAVADSVIKGRETVDSMAMRLGVSPMLVSRLCTLRRSEIERAERRGKR